MKFLLYSFAVISFLSTSCSDTILDSKKSLFNFSDTLIIKYKEVLINESDDLSLEFNELISDGRCPVDMMCFWEGDAELRFAFSNPLETVKLNLHTAGNYFTKDTLVLGYHIKLIDVYPYPHSKKAVRKSSYEAKIIIDKVLE